jgi:hypothetical protein
MRLLQLTTAARAARNAALLAALDDGAGNACVRYFADADAAADALLAERALAKPAGAVRPADGRLVLAAAAPTALVLASGAVLWAQLVAADGATVLAAGPVTDEAGLAGPAGSTADTGDIGPWVLTGTAGTQVYQGGVVAPTEMIIG